MNFYNEFDPNAAAWLRELITQGLIPDGVVDERSITEIQPHELSGFTQCHFFAGVGGWPLGLRLAGWPTDRPVGTGSCPCQPYSGAGKGLGDKDPRNLWPAFRALIFACRDHGQLWAFTVFGEQVASAIGHGWLDGVSTDLESEGYACGAVVLGAHSVGSPHQRQRLYWVADDRSGGREVEGLNSSSSSSRAEDGEREAGLDRSGCAPDGLANSERPGLQGHGRHVGDGSEPGWIDALPPGPTASGGASGFWENSVIHPCRDGKHRRVPTEPALFPLADGLPYKLARRGSVRPALLKGAGNAIVPACAAAFVRAYLDARS